MDRRRMTLLILAAAGFVTALCLYLAQRTERVGRTANEISVEIAQWKKERKAEMAAEGRLYEPGQFPNDWGYFQRAYPYDRVRFDQLREAIVDAQALRLEARRESRAAWSEKGPSNIGARVTDLAIDPTNPNVVYAAHGSSGVFRSTDGGATWTPITDGLPVLTIGAVALDPVNPDVIYVGTGEANANSYSFFGMGMFKSANGGATWDYIGLEESRYIARIVVDPLDPERLWVAATGALFGTDPERGVYRSTDGGSSWERVLAVSDSTAATDIAIDPSHPDTVYAAMWERVRGINYRRSGGLTSGIYRSHDGGDTWTELTNGLPSGTTVGRIGLSVCASSPNVVYAIYSDDPGYFAGVYKSTDGGNSWTRTADAALEGLHSSFGWYFGQIRVDPADPDRVFALGVPLYRSEDGGASWEEVGPELHVDHHALAFDPVLPSRIFEGNDGGIYVSLDSGDSWTKLFDQPTNQFYAITIDYLHPERLYGGTQDNGTLRTVSGSADEWEAIFGGDGFYCNINPTNSNVIYAEYQYGNLYKSTDFGDYWNWAMSGIASADRRNWSTPVVLDPTNPQKLYYGTYRVYRTTNGAASWSAISSDLTGGNQGGNYGTITTIAVAPTDPTVIYVGTDDSRVWVTRNGGGLWTNISGTLPDRWVTRVAVDPTDAAVAYVTFSGLRWDEEIGYVYRTDDYGTSWTDITANLPGAPVNALVIDPEAPSRIIVGTDVGCFYTESPGSPWAMLGSGLPAVPVYDLAIHGPTRTLVAGTHGRSMHAFDLSELTGVRPDRQGAGRETIVLASHPDPFASSATVVFSLVRSSHVSLAVYDLGGRLVRTLADAPLGQGEHRYEWDGRNESGRAVAPGVYFLRLETDSGVWTRKMHLVR